MDAYEYFYEIRKTNHQLRMYEDSMQELVNLSQRAGAMDYSRDIVQTSSDGQPSYVKVIERLDKQRIEYGEILADFEERKARAIHQLGYISSLGIREVMYQYIFKLKSFEQISREKYLSFSAVRKRYYRGMKEFNQKKLWEKD